MSEKKLQRRKFLADLLFAGGGLTAAALIARVSHGGEPEPIPPEPVVVGTPAPPEPVPGQMVVPEPHVKGEAIPPEPQLDGYITQPER